MQATRELNPQPSVLETDALPIELVAYAALKKQITAKRKKILSVK
jgi:hypothetical protein